MHFLTSKIQVHSIFTVNFTFCPVSSSDCQYLTGYKEKLEVLNDPAYLLSTCCPVDKALVIAYFFVQVLWSPCGFHLFSDTTDHVSRNHLQHLIF